jgi:hypothetical protein
VFLEKVGECSFIDMEDCRHFIQALEDIQDAFLLVVYLYTMYRVGRLDKVLLEFYDFEQYFIDSYIATLILYYLFCEKYKYPLDFDRFFKKHAKRENSTDYFHRLLRSWIERPELRDDFSGIYRQRENPTALNLNFRHPEFLQFLKKCGWPKKRIYDCIRENERQFIDKLYPKIISRFVEKLDTLVSLNEKIKLPNDDDQIEMNEYYEYVLKTLDGKLPKKLDWNWKQGYYRHISKILKTLNLPKTLTLEEKRRRKEIQTLTQNRPVISSTQCKGDSSECGLCLEEYKPGENIVVLNWTKGSKTCGHCFHEKCLNNINNQSTTCPICRKPITHRSTFKYFNPLQRRPSVQLSTRKKIPDFELANKTYEYVPHLMKDNMIGLDSRMQSLAPKRRLKEFDEIAPWQVNPYIEDEKDYPSPNRLPRRSSIGLMDPRVLSSIKDYDTPNNPEEVFNQLKMFVKKHQRFPRPGEKVDIYDIGDFWNKGVLKGGKYARYLADKDLQLLYFGREIQALLQFVDDKKRLPRENETYKNLNIGEFLNKIEKNYQRYNHAWKVITDNRNFLRIRANERRKM